MPNMANDRVLNQDLQFLTFTPSQARDKETRRIVRSHAIRDAVRKRKAGYREAAKDKPVASHAAHKGRFRLESAKPKNQKKGAAGHAQEAKAQLEQGLVRSNGGIQRQDKYDARLHAYQHTIIQQPGALRVDPFESLPINYGTKQRALILYQQNVTKTNSFAFNPTEAFVAYAAADPALLNATLSLLALYNDFRIGHGVSTEALFHRGEALRIVNERLRWSAAGISDGTIGAVANLAHFDTMNGLFDTALTHFNGLSQMMSTRGGLLALGSNELVQKSVGWADIAFSSAFRRAPQYPLLENPGCDGSLREYILHISYHYLPKSFISPTEHLGLDIDQIFLALRICSTILDLGEKASNEDQEQFSRGSYIVGYQLSSLMDQTEEKVASGRDLILKAAHTAALLYLSLALRDIPKTSQINKHLTTQLHNLLDPSWITLFDLSTIVSKTNDIQLMVWIFFIGASAARGLPGTEELFLQALAGVLTQLGVRDINTFKEILVSVLWVRVWSDGESFGVWKSVESVIRSERDALEDL